MIQNDGGAHVTTAGEVQGQGEYPGIPGYSALDNWTRVQATKQFSAPDYVIELLRSAGYQTPQERPESRMALDGLNMKAAKDLMPYGYRVSDDEAAQILDTYAKQYKAPAETPDLQKQQVKGESMRSAPMTLEAYNKLSDDQRKAVDFNTALVEAREKDVAGGWMIRVAPEGSDYAEDQKRMFGEDAPTGGYASNVNALLEKIKYEAPGTSLQDFLSLDMAVTAEELKDLEIPDGISFTSGKARKAVAVDNQGQVVFPGGRVQPNIVFPGSEQPEYDQLRSSENLAMIQLDTIRKAGEILAKSKSSWSSAATALDALGVGVSPEETPFGWGTPATDRSKFSPKDRTKDQNFNIVFDKLLNDTTKTKVAESDAFWDLLKRYGYDETDIDQLFNYLDQRTRWMKDTGFVVSEGQNDAAVIRELAGLEQVDG